jgi:hypothetical protein
LTMSSPSGSAWAGPAIRNLDSSSGMMLQCGNDATANVGGLIIGGSVCGIGWLQNMTYFYSKHAAGMTLKCEVTNAPLAIGTAKTDKIALWGGTPVIQQVFATGAGHTVDELIAILQTATILRQTA